MEELKKEYQEKKEAFKEKYKDAIRSIAEIQGVDLGVGCDMLEAIPRGGDYKCGVELNRDILFEDVAELTMLSKKINELS